MDLVAQPLEIMKAISRTAWDNFIKCKRCFYIERKLKIKAISTPGHPINSRVDALLKAEFDYYRKNQEPHPIFKKYNLNFVPYNMEEQKLRDFRNNFKGVRANSVKTGYTLFGSLDDLWLNKDDGKIVVVDYKATSNKNLIDYKTSDKSYHKSYLRQLEFYAYLLKLNKYNVSKTGYWILCNAGRSDQKIFDGYLDFKIDLLSYDLKTDYIEDTLVELEKCYKSKKVPPHNPYCDTCRWHKETFNL